MKKENNNAVAESSGLLLKQIQAREIEIQSACLQVASGTQSAVNLALAQGDDLHKLLNIVGQDEFVSVVASTFASDPHRPVRYMKLAKKIPADQRELVFDNPKQLDFAMHQVGLAIEPTPSTAAGTTEKSVNVAPIYERLTWLAEWTNKNRGDVNTWPDERRKDLKQQLAPVVELWETL
jgi:hypothetical protein